MVMVQLLDGIDARVASARSKAATPAYAGTTPPPAVDVAAWDRVGDPLGEALIAELREKRLMGGDVLATARELRRQGSVAAEAFFTDVEWVPGWADFDAMRAGALMGARNPVGMLMGIHGALPFSYADNATARVMASTERMLRPETIRRRFWESAAGFIGALDVEGMKPGKPRWEQWVRIRLLHTSIRMGILRSGRWDTTASMPISQAATGSGAHLFGTYRLNLIRHFGGDPTDDEAVGFELMWRWIARIEGANSELLGTTSAEQFEIAQHIGPHLYRPGPESKAATNALIGGLAKMRSTFPISRRAHAGIIRALLTDEMTQIFPGRDLPGDLGLQPDPRTDRAARLATAFGRGLNRLNNALPSTPELDRKTYDAVLNRALHQEPPTFHPAPVAGDHS